MITENSPWARAERSSANDGTLSRRGYALALAFFTAAGMAFAALLSTVSLHWKITNGWVMAGFCLGVLAVSLLGTFISYSSDNPVVSLFGYALVAGPFGLLLGPFVAHYTTASVMKVLGLTIVLVVGLGVVGALIPKSLDHWSGWLIGGAIVLIGGYFLVPLLGLLGVAVGGALTLLDWVGVVLFSAWVIYDLNRAMRLPHTVDNAIDCASAIFMDVINLFIRLLSLFGQSSD
jgi:FtsH-binding integral membrane protein